MRFDKAFHIDCRARHDEDDRYFPRARITRRGQSETVKCRATQPR
jgi:hypothetical protein